MKSILFIFAILPMLASAALPTEGKYKCSGMRAFTNTMESTKDNLVLDYWLSKAGHPVVKITTQDLNVYKSPSVFGGEKTEYLKLAKPESCPTATIQNQIADCTEASLPPLNASQNLFTTPGVQYVRNVKITGNFNLFYKSGNQRNNLAIEISYRKNASHWERVYGCELVK
jgi:hypothetical protein